MLPPIPTNEPQRLRDLQAYQILDTDTERDYDELVQLASEICNCPIAAISFIDEKRQWFKAAKNLDTRETPRNIAFCAHTINQDEVFVVKDARADERFKHNPLVTGDPQIGFYAGAPIYSSAGHKLGSVCVIDNVQKEELSEKEKKALAIIARQVSRLLELSMKNKMLKEHAEAHLKAEKRIAQLTIEESDKRESAIAYELHENLAQSLAATKLFLDSAETSGEMSPYFLQMSRESLTSTIQEVRKLSKAITPTTFQNADYYDFIFDYCQQFSDTTAIKVQMPENDGTNELKSSIGLNIFKMVQQQLDVAKNCGASRINVRIKTGRKIHVEVTDNRTVHQFDQATLDLFNAINTRVELAKGSITRKLTPKGNMLQIKLPVG